MKKFLIIAAVINLAVAIVHTFIGESDIIAPLLSTDAPNTVKWTLHAAWHMISFMLIQSTMTLFYLSGKPKDYSHSRILSKYIGIQYVFLALIFVGASVKYEIFFPQIIMLAPIGIFSILASRKN